MDKDKIIQVVVVGDNGEHIRAQMVEKIKEAMAIYPPAKDINLRVNTRIKAPYPSEHGEIKPMEAKKRDREHTLYSILDKDGIEMPTHASGRRRTFSEAFKMITRLNKNGEYGPYKMEPWSE